MASRIYLIIFSAALLADAVLSEDIFVSNLNSRCMRCLCFSASQCTFNDDCADGYCGPFQISKLYWLDAGSPVLPNDDPNRPEAYKDCAASYYCAQRIVKHYIAKFARDCNGDGVTDCMDYAMINFNGGYGCHLPLDRSESSRTYAKRYQNCTESF